MAATAKETHIPTSENQFQKIHAIIANTAEQTSRKILIILDIDGVQEGARAALEKKLFKHFRDNALFKQWFTEICFPKFLKILDKFTLDDIHFPLIGLSFEEKITTLLSYPKEKLKIALQAIINSPGISYKLILLNLEKKLLDKKELETPEKLKIYLQEQTAFVAAMHLSTALGVGDALIVGEPGEKAKTALGSIYQHYQHQDNRFLLFNLTSRTPAMAHVFKLQLDATFDHIEIRDLAQQRVHYTHDETLLRNYPTSATGNVIAASRHEKHKVTYSFLLQNGLLSNLPMQPLTIIFVDDKHDYLEDMQKLPGYVRGQLEIENTPPDCIEVITEQFVYNEKTNTVQEYINKKFNDTSFDDLTRKIRAYLQIAKEIQDPDAKEVVLYYLQPFLLDYLSSQVSSAEMNALGAKPTTWALSTAADSFVSQPSSQPTKKQKRSHETGLLATLTLTSTSQPPL